LPCKGKPTRGSPLSDLRFARQEISIRALSAVATRLGGGPFSGPISSQADEGGESWGRGPSLSVRFSDTDGIENRTQNVSLFHVVEDWLGIGAGDPIPARPDGVVQRTFFVLFLPFRRNGFPVAPRVSEGERSARRRSVAKVSRAALKL